MSMQGAVRTTCPYCGVGCGVLARKTDEGTVEIKGDPEHPANFGRLCSKGSALGETFAADDRVLTPAIDGRNVGWAQALDIVADRFSAVIAEHGPDAVAFYASGQLLTEDYYVANKLMKGFIGSGNIDTNSRLCMASTVAGHKRAFGSDTVPGCYEDLEVADLVVLVGSNFAWCHPVLFQRLLAAKEKRGTKLFVIDPRQTATTEAADLHLAVRAGSDVSLFNGLLSYMSIKGVLDDAFIAAHTEGFEAALLSAQALDVAGISKETGLDVSCLLQFYQAFSATEKVVTVYSQGVNQSSAGTDKVNAIINCHLATGRIGREGMGPFSITGQPNAMGGREVGGLANQLAAHLSIENPQHRDLVQRFWQAPNITQKPGLKAVDLFDAVGRGDIKALWVMATNPAASMPNAHAVTEALKKCPFVVLSDVTGTTKTAALADVLLPATGWGEKDGTVTNSERRISRQRAFMTAEGEARPDWWIVSQVAERMGFSGFDYKNSADIFREHAALSSMQNEQTRDFDLSGLTGLSDESYESLTPVQWPVLKSRAVGEKRMFGDRKFFTDSGKAQFVSVSQNAPMSQISVQYPLILNTGRIRDQWHMMTRTGKSARLFSHIAEPFIELHPADAAAFGISTADLVTVRSRLGAIIVRASVTDRQEKGTAFVPMHWSAPFSSCADVDTLVGSNVDPISGQPELKITAVSAERRKTGWYAFLVSSRRPTLTDFPYWSLARAKSGWRAELAGDDVPRSAQRFFQNLINSSENQDESFVSFSNGMCEGSAAFFRSGRFEGAVYFSRKPVDVARGWVADQLGSTVSTATRFRLLAGRAGGDVPDKGAIVCSCFDVGANQIRQAACAGAWSVDQIGTSLNAGTNCGSCRSEIGRIIAAVQVKEAV